MINKLPLVLCVPLLGILFGMAGCSGSGDTTTDNGGSTNPTPSTGGFTLSGLIRTSSNTITDSDVNDPAAAYQFNSSPSYAQAIPNPVVVGGYVNMPGEGASGRSQREGDGDDFYLVDLSSGQVVQLFIGSSNLLWDDLDLELWDSRQNIVAASMNRGSTEAFVVPASGRYYVRVYAYSGASNYTLSIGQNAVSYGVNSLNLSHDFAPAEVAVSFADKSSFSTMSAQAAESTFNSLGLSTKAGTPGQRMLLKLDGDQGRFKAQSALPLKFADAETRTKYETLQAVKRVQQEAGVADASPNYRYTSLAIPNDTLFRYQWHYAMINLPQAWDITKGSSNVVVAVIDTGVLVNHPDLQGKLVDGYDFISDTNISLDGNGLDSNADDPGDSGGSRTGSSFHGSHVAGSIGALTNNGKGVSGSGWNTRVMPLRVLGKGGSGYDYDIEQAIRYALGMSNDSRRTPSKAADIINLSLGGPTISSSFRQLIQEAYNRNIFVVAAAGNEGSSAASYPAALDTAISVVAVDINRQQASYSNYGSTVDIAAPGGDDTADVNGDGQADKIFSTIADDSRGSPVYLYADMMGTSMAAPHVSGVIALMKAAAPNLTPSTFFSWLQAGKLTRDLGSSGRDQLFGYGLIDAYMAVSTAVASQGGSSGSAPPTTTYPPQVSATPTALNFGQTSSTLTINIGNAGGGSLVISGASENSGGYLQLRAQSVDANGAGTYSASLTRGSLPAGTYSAAYRIESNGGTIDVPVIWQVPNTSSSGSNTSANSGNAGYQYVLLIDSDTEDTIKEFKASSRYGLYEYTFTNVPAGRYKIVSGSDSNNDYAICDPAESCGAYNTVDRPVELSVNNHLSNLDFAVSFTSNFLGSFSVGESQPIPSSGKYQRLHLRQVGP